MPVKKSAMLAHGFPSRAILARRFLATLERNCQQRACAPPKILHLGNCETFVVGYHDDASAFEDLAFSSSTTRSFWALSTGVLQFGGRTPRLSKTGSLRRFWSARVRSQTLPSAQRVRALACQSVPASGRIYCTAKAPTHRLRT